MGSMNLVEYRTDIRTELSDGSTFFTDAEIDRGVEKTEALLARLIPKKNIVEATITIDVTTETITIASSTVTMANKPIKWDSESVTSSPAGTDYTRDTDYTLNYMTGVLTEIGSQMPDTDYLITYKLDPYRLDTSSLVTNPIKITRVEYPVGNQPPTYLGGFDLIEDFLILHKDDTLTEDKHIRIYYDSKWTGATASTDGEYPSHLDDAIVIGAAGQTLIFKAEKYVQSAVTEIGLVNAAADSMATPLADINTALDKVTTNVDLAATALIKVALYLETYDDGASGTPTDNARNRLSDITDYIAYLRDLVTKLSDGTGAIADANTQLDLIVSQDLAATTSGAATLLKVPVDSTLINVVTVGEQVTRKYAQLSAGWVSIAQARTATAVALLEEANVRMAFLRTFIDEAAGWNRIAEDFIAEAVQRIASANAIANEGTQRVAEVSAWAVQADRYEVTTRSYLDIAGRYLASGQSKINEFYALLGFKPEIQHTQSSTSQATKY